MEEKMDLNINHESKKIIVNVTFKQTSQIFASL